jgi:hypothetical protein
VILYQFLTASGRSGVGDDDDAESAQGGAAAAVDAQRPGASGDGRGDEKSVAKRADDRHRRARIGNAIRAAAVPEMLPMPGAVATSADATLISTPQRVTSSSADATVAHIPPSSVAATPTASAAGMAAVAPATPAAYAAPAPPLSPAAERKSQVPAIAVFVTVAVVALAAGAWYLMQRPGVDSSRIAGVPPPSVGPGTSSSAAPSAAMPAAAPGTGHGDPARRADAAREPERWYLGGWPGRPERPALPERQGAVQSDLRADSKNQLVKRR